MFSAMLLTVAAAAWAQSASTITATPVESNQVLFNPGMGFADFHFGWGKTLPLSEYPTSRVAYFRWYWSELEPSPGQFNFAMIDNVLAQARARKQDLAFRIMPDVPAWLGAMGVEKVGTRLPNHNNAVFLSHHERLVAAFGERYGSSIYVDHVDIGSVGCWGEWNSACCPAGEGATCSRYMPTQANRDLIVNWYYKYFRGARLVAPQEGSGYPNTLGAGWRGDCFGDYNYFSPTWSHMANVYPVIAAKPEVVNNWKRSPVEFEACGVMQDWYNKGANIDLILQRGLDWHTSVFNGKNSPVPAAWRPKVDAWLKKIGYRFVLNSVTHTGQVPPGGQLQVQSAWTNKGVAPAYRAWPLAYRLRSSSDAVVAQWRSSADVRTWQPGTFSTGDTFTVPANVPQGTYSLDVAVLREDASEAYVQLAIASTRSDLWHSISQVRVGNATSTPVPPAGVAFIGADAVTKGSWRGVYGSAGFQLIGGQQSLPAYATVTPIGASGPFVWSASTVNLRALQQLTSTTRLAACWHSTTWYDIKVQFSDGNAHRVALYMLDWNYAGRSQRVDVLDAGGKLVDTRTLSDMTNGQYLVWNVSGGATFRVTRTGALNAVVSGLFFD